MKQNDSVTSDVIFYDCYNIYNIIPDLISDLWQLINSKSCVPVNSSREMWTDVLVMNIN